MASDSPIILAQLGCGYWGPNLLRSFSAQPHCVIKCVADPNPQRQEYVTKNFPGVRVTPYWDEAIKDRAIDAVIIATPASTHGELAKSALENGKHVFVEKPMATDLQGANDLVAISEKTNLVLMVGHTFLYNPAVRHLKKIVDAGELGQLYYIYSHRLNLGQVRTDVNVWWNLAPHDVSILLFLMDGQLPSSVSGRGMDYLQKGIEDVTFITLTWPTKVLAHIQLSWLDPNKVRRMTLVGSKKMVTYDDLAEDKIAVYDKGVDRIPVVGEKMDFDHLSGYKFSQRAGDVRFPRLQAEEPLRIEAAHFLDCIRQSAPPLTGSIHARDVIAILEAGEKALKSHQEVSVCKGAFQKAA